MGFNIPSGGRKRNRPWRAPRLSRRRLVSLILAAALFTGGALFCRGKVIRVVDGDTAVVFTESGTIQTVRLYGVDCPEAAQQGGREATAFARELMLFAPVSLSVTETDQYGRSVALLRLEDGRLVNEELVKSGHAWVYRAYCRQPICAAWRAYELRAKQQGLGLWRQADPVSPWRWRRSHP
jgi:endonuclease YncB( thermonuclease family)